MLYRAWLTAQAELQQRVLSYVFVDEFDTCPRWRLL